MNYKHQHQLTVLKTLINLMNKSIEFPYNGTDLIKIRNEKDSSYLYKHPELRQMCENDYIRSINNLIHKGYLLKSTSIPNEFYQGTDPLSPGSIRLPDYKNCYVVSKEGEQYYNLMTSNIIIKTLTLNKDWLAIFLSILALTISIFI